MTSAVVARTFGGLVVLGGAYLVWRNAGEIAEAVEGVGPFRLMVSWLLAIGGTLAMAAAWLAVLRGAGVAADTRDVLRAFFIGQMGKYLPGAVWPAVAQMEFGRAWGVPRPVMVGAYARLTVVLTVTGLTLGVLVPVDERFRVSWTPWLLVVPLTLIATLHPRFTSTLVGCAGRLLSREIRYPVPSVGSTMWAVAAATVAWLLLGSHFWILLDASGRGSIELLVAAVGAMGVAWATGLIVVFAPAGAGVRDGLLVAVFATAVGTASALAAVVASRVLLLLTDVLLAGWAVLHRRSSVRQ